jgi:tetratricopeptide (TPR) repeat protein
MSLGVVAQAAPGGEPPRRRVVDQQAARPAQTSTRATRLSADRFRLDDRSRGAAPGLGDASFAATTLRRSMWRIIMATTADRGRLALLAAVLLRATVVCGQEPAATPTPEVVSPLGVKHFAKADEKAEIAKAEANLAASPKDVERLLALGRAQAGAWRFRDAIATYTRALEAAPQDARLYRHRGHRFISTRQFERAVADLKRAAQLNEGDFDIWYHLGLAQYLRGEFGEAARAYERCHAVALRDRAADKDRGDDSLVAVSDWLYMTYRRLNRPADAARVLAAITPESKVRENQSYFRRLLFYQGASSEDEVRKAGEASAGEAATVGYGLGNWHLYNGNRVKAEEQFRRVVAGPSWPSFGFIAAEVELVRASRP